MCSIPFFRMQKHPNITERRIETALKQIRPQIHPETCPVTVEAWTVGGEPVTYEQAVKADYQPISVGDPWGPVWDTTWFRIRGEVPASWAGREVVVLVKIGDLAWEGFTAEGLIYDNGRPVRAINANRREIEVTKCAVGGEKFEYYVEAAANVAEPGGSLVKPEQGPLFQLRQAELSVIDRQVFDYYHDFRIAAEAMLALPEGQRRAELLYALNDSLNQLDLQDHNTVPKARAALSEVLAKKNGDTVHHLSAIGTRTSTPPGSGRCGRRCANVRGRFPPRSTTWTATPNTSSGAPKPSNTLG